MNAHTTAARTSTGSLVRRRIRQLLTASAAYRQLPSDARRQVARDMVRVAAYMSDPNGLMSREFREPLLAGVVAARGRRAARPAMTRMGAGSLAMDALVQAVDFPNFVSSLIEGVFGSIVNASLQQMQAFADLVAAVSNSVDQFASDNITDLTARSALVESFPDVFSRPGAASRRLTVRADDGAAAAARLEAAVGLREPIGDLHDKGTQERIVAATRRRLARDRQQLLATMVLMGINRIVVTDGRVVPKLPRIA